MNVVLFIACALTMRSRPVDLLPETSADGGADGGADSETVHQTDVSLQRTDVKRNASSSNRDVDVDGEVVGEGGELPVSRAAMERLADEICEELYYKQHLVAACRLNFSEALPLVTTTTVVRPTLRVRCRAATSTIVQVRVVGGPRGDGAPPTLVVLLPSDENNDTRIPHVLIEPPDEFGTIFHARARRWRLYSAALVAGRPARWWRGPPLSPLPPPAASPLPAPYHPQLTWLAQSVDNRSRRIDALLTWNTTDDDSCFEVTNICDNDSMGNFLYKKIGPASPRRVSVRALPLDEWCTLKVLGLRSAERRYRTPACRTYAHCAPLPESPVNVSVWTVRRGHGAWDVRVSWSPPAPAPAEYTVTLYARSTHNRTLPGNASSVWFRDVSGTETGMVSVSVVARTQAGSAHVSARALLDEEEPTASSTVAALGSSLAALALCSLALVGGAVWWRRQRRRREKVRFEALEKEWRAYVSAGSGVAGGADEWEISGDALALHELVGEGAFGVVRRATLRPANQQVAVKMLKDVPTPEEFRSFLAEMELIKQVGAHPHVVSLVGVCSGRRPCIVVEYCPRGDLLCYLRRAWDVMVSKRNAKYYNNNILEASQHEMRGDGKEGKLAVNKLYELEGAEEAALTPGDLLSFCRQIAKGMEFLASCRVVHRDLAARNVLVAADRTLKIADFGLSRDIYQDNQYKQKGDGKMPVKWMALESLTHRIFTTQSDIWSFGVVMWEIVTLGGEPYPGVPPARLLPLLQSGERMPRPPNTDLQLYEVMLVCWRAVPCTRGTFGTLVARLDALLTAAAAHHYLQLDRTPHPADPYAPAPAPAPPHTTSQRCGHAIAKYASLGGTWLRARYERPRRNHYSRGPDGHQTQA